MGLSRVAAADVMHGPVHIIASPFKTGTSSIASALEIIGVGSAPMPHRGDLLRAMRPAIRQAHRWVEESESFDAFRAANGERVSMAFGGLIAAMQGHDIFHDAPVGHSHIHPFVLKVLMPHAQFIWVKRPKNAWLESVKKWELSHPDIYPDCGKWHSHPDRMSEIKMKRRHGARRAFAMGRRAFRDDTLVLEWDDLGRFDKLAAFYGVGVPADPFPHQNQSQNVDGPG